jgi:hypothetical protein
LIAIFSDFYVWVARERCMNKNSQTRIENRNSSVKSPMNLYFGHFAHNKGAIDKKTSFHINLAL